MEAGKQDEREKGGDEVSYLRYTPRPTVGPTRLPEGE